MSTITTSTNAVVDGGAFSPPPQSCIDRSPRTNDLWVVARTTFTNMSFYKSVDDGATWSYQGQLVVTGLYDIGEIRIDRAGDYIHLCYLVNLGAADVVHYRPIKISTGVADFSEGTHAVATAGAAAPGDYFTSACIFPFKNPDNTFAIAIGVSFHGGTGPADPTARSGMNLYGVSIKNNTARTVYLNSGIIVSTRHYAITGYDPTLAVSVDAEHTGDGITCNTPNLWFTALLLDRIYTVKLAWQGYKTGWASPATATKISSNRNPAGYLPARWDGIRLVMTNPSTVDLELINVFERNKSNTSTIVRTSPPHPLGAIGAHMLSYNYVTKNIRLFAAAASPATQNIYYVDYDRAAATWGAWTLASSTVVLEWGVRRGLYGNNQYDLYLMSGTSPFTISHEALTINYPPTAPLWTYGVTTPGLATIPELSGAAADVGEDLALDWDFIDPNPHDAQSKYALSRQIGAATVEYWRTSDSSWQATEQQNTSGTTAVTLTAAQWLGAGGAADSAHVYKVKAWDSGSPALASVYSDGLSILPSTRVDPVLTAPTAGQVLNTGQVTATWTCSDQSAYRVTITNSVTGVLVRDSGWHQDATALLFDCGVGRNGRVMPDGFAGTLTLQTRNAEGLASAIQSAAFTCVYIEPVAAVCVPVAAASSGGINVTVTQAAPTGAQPATVSLDLWRRAAVSTTPVNANPTFETNTSDWTNSNYATMARSTAQFHSGAASVLLTPTGSAATPYAQTSSYAITGGSRQEFRGWFRSTTANKTVRCYLQWYDVASALISSSTRDMTPVAGVWIWAWFSATAPLTATSVRLAIGQIATPAAGDTLYGDDLQLFAASDDDGIRIAADIASGSTTLDWRAVTGVNFEYRGVAESSTGGDGPGPWYA